MSFLRHASLLMLNTVIGTLLAVMLNILSARLLSPAEFGAISAALAAVMLLVRAASLGLGTAAQYHGAREVAENRSYGRALALAVLIPASILSIFMAIDRAGVLEVALGGEGGNSGLLESLKWGAPVMLFHFVGSLYMLGKKDLGAYLLLTTVPLFTSLCFVVGGMINHSGINAVTQAWQAQFIVSFILGVHFLLRSASPNKMTFRAAAHSIFIFGARSYPVFIASFTVTRIGVLSGAWFTSDGEVGFFATGKTFAESLLLVYGAIGPLVFSHVGSMNNTEGAHEFIGQVARLSMILFSTCSLAIAALAPWGMKLIFGAPYAEGYVIVWWLLPGAIFSALQRIFENYLYGRGKHTWLVTGHLVGIAAAVGGGALFAPSWGARGLAVASSLSCAGALVTTLLMVCYMDGVRLIEVLVPRGEDWRLLFEKGNSSVKKLWHEFPFRRGV